MIRRIAGVLGLAAIFAACPALATPAVGAAAAKPGYVGIVISGHGSYCVKWTSGITGDAVLNKVARVAYRNDGIILQIDGDPTSGTADNSHFWSYWHDTSGTWTYSNYGASSYDPKAGSVEGWSYDNGASSPPKPAPNPSGLYTTLCGKLDSSGASGASRTTPAHATHSTTPTARTTTAAARHRPAATSTPGASTPTRTGSTPSTASSSATPGPGGQRSGTPRATGSRTPATNPRTSSSAPDVVAVGGRKSLRASSVADSSSRSTASPVGLIVGAGLVVVLGAGAGAVALRRRGAGG